MTILYSDNCALYGGVQPRSGIGFCTVSGHYDLSATVDIETADVIQLVKIPKGATVLDLILDVPVIDTGTAIVWGLGDDGSPSRYIAAEATMGRVGAGGIKRLTVAGSSQYAYTADNTIDMIFGTGAATATATTGIIKLTVFYTFDL